MHSATQIEKRRRETQTTSEDVGCIAANGSDFEPSVGFEEQVIEDVVMIIFWSSNDAFAKGDNIREAPNSNYKEDVNMLIHNLRRWRHCLVIGLGTASCWSLNARLDDVTEKYNNYIECRAVPQSPTAVTTIMPHSSLLTSSTVKSLLSSILRPPG